MNGFKWPGRRHVAPETPLQLAERLPGLRVDPRHVHTTQTPPEPAGDAGVDAEAQEAREAAMAALRARVDAMNARPVVVAKPAPEVVDPAELVRREVARVLGERDREQAAREQREAAEAAAAERQRQRALAIGGPCRWCGATESWQRDEHGTRLGCWYEGPECALCNYERAQWPQSTDLDRRYALLKSLLPEAVIEQWHRGHLLEKVQFRWWYETPGAITSDRERWAYVDVDRMVTVLEPPKPQLVMREPCPRCGCPSRWLWTRAYQPAGSGQVAVEQWKCTGCRDSGDLVALTARTTGLTPWRVESLGAAAAEVFGVHWWADDPNGGKADPPRPCEVPFRYVDVAAAQRTAFRLFPGERAYGNPAAWQAAKTAAQS